MVIEVLVVWVVNLIALLVIGARTKRWGTLAWVALGWTLAGAVVAVAVRPELQHASSLMLTLGFAVKFGTNLLLLAIGRGIGYVVRKVRSRELKEA
ncbi:hypothetical protein V5F38_14265 [Xanthobacter sp. V0B-10]|uniref:hypothetical protein n=1 Tax=Xanthobacter albus TaxID=3119929 RepID=UPI003727707D